MTVLGDCDTYRHEHDWSWSNDVHSVVLTFWSKMAECWLTNKQDPYSLSKIENQIKSVKNSVHRFSRLRAGRRPGFNHIDEIGREKCMQFSPFWFVFHLSKFQPCIFKSKQDKTVLNSWPKEDQFCEAVVSTIPAHSSSYAPFHSLANQ